MLHNGRYAWIWIALLLSPRPLSCHADSPSLSIPPETASSTPQIRVCWATAVNCIANELPSQCLNTDSRSSPDASGPSLLPVSHHGTETVVEVASTISTESNAVHDTESGTIAITLLPDTTNTINLQPPASTRINLAVSGQPETEGDSELDNAKFLSFEDWKKNNLAQAGQSVETLGQVRGVKNSGQDRSRLDNINNALDALGDGLEIDLDFSGFGGSSKSEQWHGSTIGSSTGTVVDLLERPSRAPHSRNKDAGKTCKERFNYASFDCAANVLKTNPRCKSSSSVLVENKDSYMLSECGVDNKFLIVELCDDILIDTVVLANFEFFSSSFRNFKLSVSDRYPVKIEKWKELGTYEARNSREIQAFLVENPLIWARYLRIEFLTHYGNEYYCPVSLLRVHGTTMMAEFRHQEELARGEADWDDEPEDVATSPTEKEPAVGQSSVSSAFVTATELRPYPDPVSVVEENWTEPLSSHSGHVVSTVSVTTQSLEQSAPATTARSKQCGPAGLAELWLLHKATCPAAKLPHDIVDVKPPSPAETHGASISTSATAMVSGISCSSSFAVSAWTGTLIQASSSQHNDFESPRTDSIVQTASHSLSSSFVISPLLASPVSTSSHASPSPSAPATQESFFYSLHKRLLFLESNATLSLQYIESQSQLLRDAFVRVEKRNLAKTNSLLGTLNDTVVSELTRYRGEYKQLWQSTVLELASQREQGRIERDILGEKVRALAEEVVGQKRLMAVQATLLLLCLAVVIFGKAGISGVDVSLLHGVQDMVSKGKHARSDSRRGWHWERPWASPPRSRESTRPGTGEPRRHELALDADASQQYTDSDGENHNHLDTRYNGGEGAAVIENQGVPTTMMLGTPVYNLPPDQDLDDAVSEGSGQEF